jgi:hypothetical protein
MKSIINRIETIEKLSKDNKSYINELKNLYYRLDRMEKYLNENFEYTVLKNTPEHYTHRNVKV